VFNGFAGLKFSGSPIMFGLKSTNIKNIIIKIKVPIKSLEVKKGWKLILSKFGFIPVGEFDPVRCKDIRWIITKAERTKGKRK
jgi:hypothetical protein